MLRTPIKMVRAPRRTLRPQRLISYWGRDFTGSPKITELSWTRVYNIGILPAVRGIPCRSWPGLKVSTTTTEREAYSVQREPISGKLRLPNA